jgi:hypothetical protein
MRFHFKTILVSTIATIGAFCAIVYTSSCNRDKCKTIVCANAGVCNDGGCNCPAGFEGTNCEKVARDKFLGNWHVLEKGSITLAAQYAISIEASNNLTEVTIKNFYNYFKTPIKAYIKADSIFIPNQQYEGKLLFGIGYIYSNVTYGQYGAIEMRYEIIDTATQRVNDFGYNEAVDHSDPSLWNK